MTRRGERTLLASCAAVYLLVATRLTDGLLRRQFDNGAYSHFFDHQAQAFLDGHLALPRGAIGIEAFIVDGREHMYFGIFPALLRVPILAVTDTLFGDLTLLSSFVAWLVFVMSAWRLADRALPLLVAPDAESASDTSIERVCVRRLSVIWKVTVGLGSPMLMLAGPAWVFSEAIMWGVAISLFFQYRLLCELQSSSVRNQLWLAVALVLAVLNRPTHALGCLATMVVLVGVRAARRRAVTDDMIRLGAATALAAIIMVIPNWLRFGRIYGLPMDAHLISQVEDYRRRMLAYAGNDYTDIRYMPSNVMAYLRPDGISVSSRFPFVNAPQDIPTVYLDAIHDITNRTPSIVASTPLLFGLAIVGLVIGLRSVRVGGPRRQLLFLACAGVPAVAAHLVWGFITPRFLADFLPLMLPLGLIALAAIAVRLERMIPERRRLATAALVALAVLGAWSVVANIGLALGSSYATGYDGDVDEYVELQGRADYWADGQRRATVADFTFERDDPPPPDTIAVLGDCEAAYISTGEQVDPWLPLAYGPADFRRVFAVDLSGELAGDATPIRLATFTALDPPAPDRPGVFHVDMVVGADGVRLQLTDEFGYVEYPLDDLAPDETFELAVTSDPVRRVLSFDVDGTTAGYGHHLTRPLYDGAGQRVEFSDGADAPGAVVRVVEPVRPC